MANTNRQQNKEMKNFILISLTALILSNCGQTKKHNEIIDINKQTQILQFYRTLFASKIINSKYKLDSLTLFADKVIEDTSKYVRTPKANLYISTNTNTSFQVFEKPKGTITAIAFYLNGKRINAAEYYKNGQVMCLFSANEQGKRNGKYECYNENGSYRHIGYYKNDKEIADSLRRFSE